ncbi:MAG TPA: hypothetical protein VL049_17310, partial [Candidatus Dormibacteraeota bacterium]|nr:hypothetical protein [Candidatus Dormibacteraeota bacterium]
MNPARDRAPCPYVGLQPFQERDAEFFFGREREQRVIISNLLASPLTILYGASGVGKTSVLLAGVVPQLRRERPRTPVVVFRTWIGDDFQSALTRACIAEVWKDGRDQPRPAETLPFDEMLRACGEAAHETILVLFDQFEEYFLYHPKSVAADSFEAQFARAVNRDDVNVGFLISLREDSLAKLDYFQERIPNLLSNRLRLKHLDEAAAETALRRPLEVWNRKYAGDQPPVTIEDELVTQLIEQVQSGRVSVGRDGGTGVAQSAERFVEAPFLQLVMNRLWAEEMDAGSRMLRLATLRRLKGAQEIVHAHLEDVMAGLDVNSQAVCASFFDHLVTPTRSKVACTLEDLTQWAGPELAPRVPAVLASLAQPDKRILRTAVASPDRPQATSYEIYHDVLAQAILDWRRLYVERRERAAAVQQAHEQAARRALRQWVWALAAMTALAIVGWLDAYRQRLLAEANQKAAESMAASAHDPGRGLELALAAVGKTKKYHLAPTGASEDALRRAIQASRLQWSLPVGGWVSDVAFTADGRRLAIASWAERQFNPDRDPTLRLVDLGDGRPVLKAARSILHPNWVQAVALPPVGDRLATMAGNSVWLRPLDQTDAAPRTFTPGTSTLSALAVSTDGARLAAANRGERFITIWDLDPASSQPPVAIDTGGQW